MWKKELVEILFSNDPSKLNVKKAINLKYENTPSSLYRYRSFNERSLELLEIDKMYLSKPTEFNDPFDCGLKLASKDLSDDYFKGNLLEPFFSPIKQQFSCSSKSLGKLKRSKNVVHDLAKFYVKTDPRIKLKERSKYIKEIENNLKSGYLDLGFKKNMHVACFSETYKSILMWSHYADNHKGFCIEYNFKGLGLNNPVARFIFPVIYNNTIFDFKDYLPDSNKLFNNVLKNYMDKIKEEDILEGITLPNSNKHINNMVIFYNALIKSKEWSYEKEWRYVFPFINTSDKKVHLPVPKPKTIYLGAKIDKKDCEKLLKIAKERDITVYHMKIKPSEFALEHNIIYESKNIQGYNKIGKDSVKI